MSPSNSKLRKILLSDTLSVYKKLNRTSVEMIEDFVFIQSATGLSEKKLSSRRIIKFMNEEFFGKNK